MEGEIDGVTVTSEMTSEIEVPVTNKTETTSTTASSSSEEVDKW
jgi:hypothetical protein